MEQFLKLFHSEHDNYIFDIGLQMLQTWLMVSLI